MNNLVNIIQTFESSSREIKSISVTYKGFKGKSVYTVVASGKFFYIFLDGSPLPLEETNMFPKHTSVKKAWDEILGVVEEDGGTPVITYR